MERPVTQAALECGLIDEASLAQLKKWRMISDEETENWAKTTLNTPESIVQRLHEALESGEVVEIRATDVDIVNLWLRTRQKAKLHLPDPGKEGKTVAINVEYCLNKMGEYVIPWTSEGIMDLMMDEDTYLKPVGSPRVHFADVRELFFGDHKAFIVLEPAKEI
jgi:hypothetical protein